MTSPRDRPSGLSRGLAEFCEPEHLAERLGLRLESFSGDSGVAWKLCMSPHAPSVAWCPCELERAGVAEKPTVAVADAGYWHYEQMDSLAAGGIRVLIPPDAGKRKGARPGWQGGRYEWMRRVLATALGQRLYRTRSRTVQPVFGHTKHNRGMSRFHRRGRSAVRTRMAPDRGHSQPHEAPQ